MPVPTTPNPEPGPPAPSPVPDPYRKPVEDPPEIQPPAPVREPPLAPPTLAWMSGDADRAITYPKVGPSTSSRRKRSASSGLTRWASKPACSARLMSVPCP